jgi:alkanesulfonate monooxygenase SsuD/methylene tetrahydromethanopterin reductase-like flavin-dependent oxidoreductase (luciferase family)
VPNSFDRNLLRLRPFADYLNAGWTHLGTPDEVREGLERYMETTGIRRLLLLMALPGIATEHALRSMRMFMDHVAPKLSAASPRAVSR